MGNIMINSVKPITEYVQMCRSSGGNFLKPIPKFSALKLDCATFSKVANNLDDIFESKTLRKLFTDEFKPSRRVDEFGNPITTVIDKKTGKPVEVVIKNGKSGKYIFEIKCPNSQKAFFLIPKNYLGHITMCLTNGVYIEYMNTQLGDLKYKGIGTRMHQFAIEMSMKLEKGGKVLLEAANDSPVFHYKSGFRPMDIAEDALTYEQQIKEDILNGKKTRVVGSLFMELCGEQFEKWKARIRTQPILLD